MIDSNVHQQPGDNETVLFTEGENNHLPPNPSHIIIPLTRVTEFEKVTQILNLSQKNEVYFSKTFQIETDHLRNLSATFIRQNNFLR